MLVADQLVDAAAKHQILSFMDGHSGYKKIYIAKEDIPKIAFRCPGAIGTFEWVQAPNPIIYEWAFGIQLALYR